MTDTLIKVDGVYGMWQGERIAEIMEYTQDAGHVWTIDTMLNYFEKLVECHDLFVSTNGFVANSLDDIQPIDFTGLTSLQKWGHIRNAVLDYSVQFPNNTILEILDKMGIILEEFYAAVTVNKKNCPMNRKTFGDFCTECLADKPNFAKIGREFGTGVNTMVYFKKLFRAIKTARTEGD
jgi:hypothetical protein